MILTLRNHTATWPDCDAKIRKHANSSRFCELTFLDVSSTLSLVTEPNNQPSVHSPCYLVEIANGSVIRRKWHYMLSIPSEEVLTQHIQALQALVDWHRQAAATIDAHRNTLFDHLQRWDRNHANTHQQWSAALRDRHLQQADSFEQTIQWLRTSFAAQYAVDQARVIS